MTAAFGQSVELALKMDFAMRNKLNESFDTHTPLTGIAIYLIRDGLLDNTTATDAIQAAQQQNLPLIHYLVKAKILSSQTILNCCVKHFELPFFDLKNYDVTILNHALIHAELIHRYRVIPLYKEENCLSLAITDPTDHAALNAVSFHTGLRIRPMLVAVADLDNIITHFAQSTLLGSQLETALAKIPPLEEQLPPDLMTQNDEPVSEFVDHLIQDAVEKNVSDIHIEPQADAYRIRFRRDGLLTKAAIVPSSLALRVITRLKILAHLNIAERRLPQDGRFALSPPTSIDIRLSTCPTLWGEKIVLRLLNNKKIKLDIDTIGLTQTQKDLFLSACTQPQGLILVTGPTGSGKTMTLYTALHFLNHTEKNISSVEDPVEIELTGINQVNVNSRIGLNFASVLRALLRQDPDILMVGEIRDKETAHIALQAAQTGHLVLSTLHTNNAVESIFRLQSMGTDVYHFISSMTLIIAQRLMRKLCQHCKQPETLPIPAHDKFNSSALITYQAKGCEQCHQGYSGRIGIFEFIPITEKVAQHIVSGTTIQQLLALIKKEGWMLLWQAGLEKVHSGITSYTELLRVVGHFS